MSARCGSLSALLLVVALSWPFTRLQADPSPPTQARVLVQRTLAAGLRHHDAKAVWSDLREGDAVDLVREGDNLHDRGAVRIDWRGRVLGYVPARDNADLARQLDRGQALRARITKVTLFRNYRKKLEVEIYIDL